MAHTSVVDQLFYVSLKVERDKATFRTPEKKAKTFSA